MRIIYLILLCSILFVSCHNKAEIKLLAPHKIFIDNLIEGNESFYSIENSDHSEPDKKLAIGIFDSGIGGLTVFDAIINSDFFDGAYKNQPDGLKDFSHEQFVYLADQCNMPYSNYVEEGNKELLVENTLKDAVFLLNNKYHASAGSSSVSENKPGIKAMVIACNTATAYGKPQVEELCKVSGTNIKVIGVIDAGCKGALEVISDQKKSTIAVLATPATVSSMAYVNTLNELKTSYNVNINIIQQGGKGLHESIDNKNEFIRSNYTRLYKEYQGPSVDSKQYRIEKHLIDYYNFDTTQFHILYNKYNLKTSDTIQINSIDNYVRYHIVSLVEQLKLRKDTIPLKVIILGCTHYPYVTDVINHVLEELRETDRYSQLISDSINIIDPALNTAKELYSYLNSENLLNDDQGGNDLITKSLFFLTVPNTFEPSVETDSGMRFTYDYQYKKRKINELKNYTLTVPFARDLISGDQMNMIQTKLPYTYELLNKFMKGN